MDAFSRVHGAGPAADGDDRPAWVTGAGGLIGNCICRLPCRPSGWRIIPLTRTELDLTDFRRVAERFQRDKPRAIIHCAALSRSPACQAEPALAQRVNVDATRFLVELSAEIPFLFFSTDLVFDGRQGNYDETAPVNPLSVYAETKVAAERIVAVHPRHLIVRTSLNGGRSPGGDRGFNEELRRMWERGDVPRLFVDEFRSPIPAVVTARAVWELLAAGCTGTFHVAGSERMSRCDIGRAVAARWASLNPRIEASSLREYTGAPRPPDTSLNCAKAQGVLSFRLPGLREWLSEHPDEIF